MNARTFPRYFSACRPARPHPRAFLCGFLLASCLMMAQAAAELDPDADPPRCADIGAPAVTNLNGRALQHRSGIDSEAIRQVHALLDARCWETAGAALSLLEGAVDSVHIQIGRARFRDMFGGNDSLLLVLEDIADAGQEHPFARVWLSSLLIDHGHFERAELLLEPLRDLFPDDLDIYVNGLILDTVVLPAPRSRDALRDIVGDATVPGAVRERAGVHLLRLLAPPLGEPVARQLMAFESPRSMPVKRDLLVGLLFSQHKFEAAALELEKALSAGELQQPGRRLLAQVYLSLASQATAPETARFVAKATEAAGGEAQLKAWLTEDGASAEVMSLLEGGEPARE